MRCIYQSHMWCPVLRVPAREVPIWFHPQRVVPTHLPGHISNLLSAAWLAPGLEHLVCLQAPTLIAPQSIVGFPHILLGLQVRSNHISPESQIKSQFPICFPHIFLGVLRVLQLPRPSSPQDFTLHLSGCCTLRRFGCAASLPRTLRRLELGLDSCERLQDATELLRGIGPLDANHRGVNTR